MPLHIQITPWPAKVTYGHWEVPATEPALNLFTRSHSTDPWKSLGGVEPSQILSHYAGVLINANSDLDGGVLYLYDNMGTAVASIDLLPLFQTMHEAGRNGELRSGFQAWVAWNGKTSSGSMASSGVYLGRIFAWKGVGAERSVINQTYRLGWQVNQAPSWDEYGMPNW